MKNKEQIELQIKDLKDILAAKIEISYSDCNNVLEGVSDFVDDYGEINILKGKIYALEWVLDNEGD
jgi:hypothetical protein